MRFLDPIAHWILAKSLGLTEHRPYDAFAPFFRSILNVFVCEDPALLLDRFAFLETRFALIAKDDEESHWSKLSFDVSFLDRIIYEDPKILAKSITHDESRFFLGLTFSDFNKNRSQTIHLDAIRSNALANDIVSCFAVSNFLGRMIQLVKVKFTPFAVIIYLVNLFF